MKAQAKVNITHRGQADYTKNRLKTKVTLMIT